MSTSIVTPSLVQTQEMFSAILNNPMITNWDISKTLAMTEKFCSGKGKTLFRQKPPFKIETGEMIRLVDWYYRSYGRYNIDLKTILTQFWSAVLDMENLRNTYSPTIDTSGISPFNVHCQHMDIFGEDCYGEVVCLGFRKVDTQDSEGNKVVFTLALYVCTGHLLQRKYDRYLAPETFFINRISQAA